MSEGPRLDLHVHSRHSPDSRLAIREIVDHLGERGLQGFALTDHNSIAGHEELRDLAARNPGLLLIPGVEVSTREGHLLAYGLGELPPAGAPIEATIAWVESHGGIAVPAHPTRLFHGIGLRKVEQLSLHALETLNGHTAELGNARAELVAARRHIGSTGGSDVHDLRDLGRCYTQFPDEVRSVEDALGALRQGRSRSGGRSMSRPERLRLALSHLLGRASRGFRPI